MTNTSISVKSIRIALASTLVAAVCTGAAHAQTAAPADPAPYAVTGNVAITTDYMFRGLTQTWAGPAIQGGGDVVLSNGFAAGFWGSSISDKTYPGAALELDIYANYGQQFNDDWSWRVGLYAYLYPQGNLDQAHLASRSFNTLEANAALTWRWLTLKYSSALTDYFGIDTEQGYASDSKGTGYLQLDAAIPIDAAWSLALHAAHTHIPTRLAFANAYATSNADYADFGATLKYQFSTRWNVSIGATYTTNHAFYAHTSSFSDAADVRDVGGTRGYAMLQGTF